MEYEQLEKGSSIITQCVYNQDIGHYVDILDPEVLLVTHFLYPESGAPVAVISDAVKTLHQSENWEKRKKRLLQESAERLAEQQKRYEAYLGRSQPTSKEEGEPAPEERSSVTGKTAAPKKAPAKSTTAARPTAASTSRDPKGYQHFMQDPEEAARSADYGERVDIVEGPTLVAERMCILLNWIGKGKYVAEVQAALDPRKRVLQDNDVLPPPPAPTTEAERYGLLGVQYTDRNQKLSSLTMTYGRESLLFRDVCLFEDGVILTIHRYLVSLREMLEKPIGGMLTLSVAQRTEKIKESVLDFYDGLQKSRISAVNHTLPMLDFSFVDIDEPLKLLSVAPTAGKKHVSRSVRPTEDPRFAQGVFLSQATDPTANTSGPGKRTMIKAKNKRGEEEAYEFDKGEGDRFAFMRGGAADNTPTVNTSVEALVASASAESRYDANSLRVASCGLGDHIERLVPVIRRLVANALVTLSSLDLSDNRISVLPPDLHQLPLQKLQLHGNQISDFKEVVEKVCPLPYLAFLTLHGNPIAEQKDVYWPMALRHLLSHPNRQVKLRSLDFVVLTAQDYNVAGAHDLFERGDDTLLQKAKMVSSGRPTPNTALYKSTKGGTQRGGSSTRK